MYGIYQSYFYPSAKSPQPYLGREFRDVLRQHNIPMTRFIRRFYHADGKNESDPADDVDDDHNLPNVHLVGDGAQHRSAEELNEGTTSDQETALRGIHADLLVVNLKYSQNRS